MSRMDHAVPLRAIAVVAGPRGEIDVAPPPRRTLHGSSMRICLVGIDNLPVLAPGFERERIGGESVQQTLIARALAQRGHRVSMVTADYGQPDGASWDGVRVWKAYSPRAGIPVLRFVHPRWTGLWS